MRFNREAFVGLLNKDLLLHGETPAAWARRVGTSPGSLHDIVHGRRQPSTALMQKLAKGLGVPVGAIAHEVKRASA